MAVLFWYLVKGGASVRYCTAAYTGQVTFYEVSDTRSCITGHTAYESASFS